MVKILFAILLTLMSVVCRAGQKADVSGQDIFTELIREYNHEDHFHIVQIGTFGTSAIKKMLHAAAATDNDPDLRNMLQVIKGIRKITIIDYEECHEEVCRRFNRNLGQLLEQCDMLFETKDGDDVMHMYGIIDNESDTVRNFIMYSPSDCKLICLFGTIKLDSVANMVAK